MRIRDIHHTLTELIKMEYQSSIVLNTDEFRFHEEHFLKLEPEKDTPILSLFSIYVVNKTLYALFQMFKDDPDTLLAESHITTLLGLIRSYVEFGLARPTFCITHSPHFPHAKCLIALAQILAEPTKLNKYQIIFPSIEIFDYEMTSTSLFDADLQLHEFLLASDSKSIINVRDSLDFAVNDGVLKHTCLFNGEVRELDEEEIKSVVRHSGKTKSYWRDILKKVRIEKNGLNMGAALTRLVEKLKKGGAHGRSGGSELDSGCDANIGIQVFFEWFDLLNEKDQHLLTSCVAPRLPSLGELIDRLRRPSHVSYRSISFCVELISSNIEQILEANASLFNIYPENKQPAPDDYCDLIEQRRRVAEAGRDLKNAMMGYAYETDSREGPPVCMATIDLLCLPDLASHAYEKVKYLFKSLEEKKPYQVIAWYIKEYKRKDFTQFIKNTCHAIGSHPDCIYPLLSILNEPFNEQEATEVLQLLAPNILAGIQDNLALVFIASHFDQRMPIAMMMSALYAGKKENLFLYVTTAINLIDTNLKYSPDIPLILESLPEFFNYCFEMHSHAEDPTGFQKLLLDDAFLKLLSHVYKDINLRSKLSEALLISTSKYFSSLDKIEERLSKITGSSEEKMLGLKKMLQQPEHIDVNHLYLIMKRAPTAFMSSLLFYFSNLVGMPDWIHLIDKLVKNNNVTLINRGHYILFQIFSHPKTRSLIMTWLERKKMTQEQLLRMNINAYSAIKDKAVCALIQTWLAKGLMNMEQFINISASVYYTLAEQPAFREVIISHLETGKLSMLELLTVTNRNIHFALANRKIKELILSWLTAKAVTMKQVLGITEFITRLLENKETYVMVTGWINKKCLTVGEVLNITADAYTILWIEKTRELIVKCLSEKTITLKQLFLANSGAYNALKNIHLKALMLEGKMTMSDILQINHGEEIALRDPQIIDEWIRKRLPQLSLRHYGLFSEAPPAETASSKNEGSMSLNGAK